MDALSEWRASGSEPNMASMCVDEALSFVRRAIVNPCPSTSDTTARAVRSSWTTFVACGEPDATAAGPVSYTHLRAHETRHDLVCRLLLEKKKNNKKNITSCVR